MAEKYSYGDDMVIIAEKAARTIKDSVEKGKLTGDSLLEIWKSKASSLLESSEASIVMGPGQPMLCASKRDL